MNELHFVESRLLVDPDAIPAVSTHSISVMCENFNAQFFGKQQWLARSAKRSLVRDIVIPITRCEQCERKSNQATHDLCIVIWIINGSPYTRNVVTSQQSDETRWLDGEMAMQSFRSDARTPCIEISPIDGMAKADLTFHLLYLDCVGESLLQIALSGFACKIECIITIVQNLVCVGGDYFP